MFGNKKLSTFLPSQYRPASGDSDKMDNQEPFFDITPQNSGMATVGQKNSFIKAFLKIDL